MTLPKYLQEMSEEEILQDQLNFKIALELVPQLKVARTMANHGAARSGVCLRYKLPTNAVYTVDAYSVHIATNHANMDHEPEKVVEHYRDDSGERRNNRPNANKAFGTDPISFQEFKGYKFELKNLETELRYDLPRGKSDPRVLRRDELLKKLDDSDFIFDEADQDRKIKRFRQSKPAEAFVPLDLSTPDSDLHKATALQIKDLLRRRKEEREKVI